MQSIFKKIADLAPEWRYREMYSELAKVEHGRFAGMFNRWLEECDTQVLRNCPRCGSVLNAGSGNGRNDRMLKVVTNSYDVIDCDILTGVDLDKPLPYAERRFDLIFCNQVIEHLYNPLGFLRESNRILTDSGKIVIGTENLASWPNLFAMVCGYQPFSLSNVCGKRVGNMFGDYGDWSNDPHGSHVTVFSPKGLASLLEHAGFKAEVKTVGWHKHFMVGVGRK
jgi:SAM-dependent methyltransferase